MFARAYVLLLVPILLGQGPAVVVHEPDAPAEPDETVVKDPPRQDEGFLLGELHYSILTDLSERSTLAPAFGYALKGGYRWGIFAQFEQNMWVATELDREVVLGAFNTAVTSGAVE